MAAKSQILNQSGAVTYSFKKQDIAVIGDQELGEHGELEELE